MANDNVIDIQTRQVAELMNATPPQRGGGGGGASGGADDGRLEKIETRLGSIEGEQRTHLRWVVTIALALAAIIVTSSAFLMSRVDRVEDRLSRLESNVNDLPGKLTSSLSQINQTLFQAISASKSPAPQVIILPPATQEAVPKQ